jgi:dienelactone hydrolase
MPGEAMSLEYRDGDTSLKGSYYLPEAATGPLPVVLVVPAWDGLVQEVHDKAQRLAADGYLALAVDVYGDGLTLDDMSQLEAVIGPFMADRKLLIRRMQAAVDAALTIPGVDAGRVGAMGYCFGGLCVLDLARAGGETVRGVVSFHGALLAPDPHPGLPVRASVLALHGNDDPLVPPEQVAGFMKEMDAHGADWQLVSYGGVMHAFTRPDANLPEAGAVYDADADRRSWRAMLDFFEEVLA